MVGRKEVVTSEEDKLIKEYWEMLPGNYSYYDVVAKLAKGDL